MSPSVLRRSPRTSQDSSPASGEAKHPSSHACGGGASAKPEVRQDGGGLRECDGLRDAPSPPLNTLVPRCPLTHRISCVNGEGRRSDQRFAPYLFLFCFARATGVLISLSRICHLRNGGTSARVRTSSRASALGRAPRDAPVSRAPHFSVDGVYRSCATKPLSLRA